MVGVCEAAMPPMMRAMPVLLLKLMQMPCDISLRIMLPETGSARSVLEKAPGLDIRNESPLPTWVEIDFLPAGDGTRVAFRHYGFRDGELWSASQTWFTRAWQGVLDPLTGQCRGETTA